MLIPVPQNLEGKRAGVSPALTEALEALLGPRGERWSIQSYFAPSTMHEIDIPDVRDASLFNKTFPNFSEGKLTVA